MRLAALAALGVVMAAAGLCRYAVAAVARAARAAARLCRRAVAALARAASAVASAAAAGARASQRAVTAVARRIGAGAWAVWAGAAATGRAAARGTTAVARLVGRGVRAIGAGVAGAAILAVMAVTGVTRAVRHRVALLRRRGTRAAARHAVAVLRTPVGWVSGATEILSRIVGAVFSALWGFAAATAHDTAALIRGFVLETPARSVPWRRLRNLSVVALVALLAAIWAGYNVSLSGLHPRQLEFATSEAEILVDTPTSVLVDADQATNGPASLALTYALYLKTDATAEAVARAVGVRREDIATSGPFTTLLDRTNVALRTPTPPRPQDRRYRLVVDVAYNRPVLTLYGQAPTTREAATIVDSARQQLGIRVREQQASSLQGPDTRAVLRPLGPTEAGIVNPGATRNLMIFVFAVVLLTGLFAMRWLDRRRALRELGAARPGVKLLDRLDDDALAGDDWPHTTRLLPWALAGFVVMLFLIPFDSVDLPVNLPLDSKLDRPVLIMITMLWLASLAVVTGAARPRIRLTRVHIAALAFFAVCLLSIVVNGPALVNLDELTLVVKKIALLASYLLFFVIVASVVRPREVPRFAVLMIALAVVAAVGGIIEYRLRVNPFYSWTGMILPVAPPEDLFSRDSIGRLTVYGPTGNPVELATMLGMVLPFALVGALGTQDRRKRLLYVIAVGLLLAGAMATVRKTSVVAPAAGILVLIAYQPRAVLRRLLPLGLLLGVIVHFTSPGSIGSLVDQLNPSKFNSVLTTKDRTSDYDGVRPDVTSHLLLGRGFQSYDGKKYRILDNEYLALLIGTGLIGVLCYISIFLAAISAAHPLIRGPDSRRASLALAGAAAVGVMAAVTALFDDLSFQHVPYLFFFIAGLILALREPSPQPDAVPAAVRAARRKPRPRPATGGLLRQPEPARFR